MIIIRQYQQHRQILFVQIKKSRIKKRKQGNQFHIELSYHFNGTELKSAVFLFEQLTIANIKHFSTLIKKKTN